MSAIQEVVTEAPAVEAVPKRAMTLGYGSSLVMLALLIAAPLFVKNFIIFQLTMLLIYALAVLALNILTGGSGQFSLGQSAFYAVGAYTSAILMEHGGMNYALTLPVAGIVCFGFGFLFGQPALRLSGVYLALATFALATAMPQILKLGYFEHWTGGVQGLVVTKPDAPFGLPMSQDMWLYYFTLVVTIAIYIFSVNLLKSRSGRAFMAIRDNEIAASAMGIDVALYKTLAFGVSAGITGVAGGLGAITVQFVAPDGYTITLAISLFLGMVVGGVGWLPGSIVGSAFIIFVPNIAESISKGLSGAVFGVLLFFVIFLVPHGARQVAMIIQHLIKHGFALEMTDKARRAFSLAALALAVLAMVVPIGPAIEVGMPVSWIVPFLSAVAAICATIAALAGDRISAVIVSAVVLNNLLLVSPWLRILKSDLAWTGGNLAFVIPVWLFGIAPLVAVALNMRASFDVPARKKSV
jgi:branched-chain amino acid transport system permease protein